MRLNPTTVLKMCCNVGAVLDTRGLYRNDRKKAKNTQITSLTELSPIPDASAMPGAGSYCRNREIMVSIPSVVLIGIIKIGSYLLVVYTISRLHIILLN